MSDPPPDRFNVSIPPDHPLDLEELDALVEQSEYGNRSEYVRAVLMDSTDE